MDERDSLPTATNFLYINWKGIGKQNKCSNTSEYLKQLLHMPCMKYTL